MRTYLKIEFNLKKCLWCFPCQLNLTIKNFEDYTASYFLDSNIIIINNSNIFSNNSNILDSDFVINYITINDLLNDIGV